MGELLINPLSDLGAKFIFTLTSQPPPPLLREIQQHEENLHTGQHNNVL